MGRRFSYTAILAGAFYVARAGPERGRAERPPWPPDPMGPHPRYTVYYVVTADKHNLTILMRASILRTQLVNADKRNHAPYPLWVFFLVVMQTDTSPCDANDLETVIVLAVWWALSNHANLLSSSSPIKQDMKARALC